MASTSILLAGFIVGTYCVQLRGPGLATLLANGRLPELVLVAGALLALAVVVHLSVVRAMAASRGPTTSVRGLLRRALELLESPEGGASEAYAALPAEVRELVGLFESQRTREQQIEREKQRLRTEMQALTAALEQSGASLEPLTVSSADEFSGRVAQVWNQLLARAQGGAAREPLPARTASTAAPAAFPAWASGAVTEAPSSAVTQRLQELEGRFAALQEQMRTLHTMEAPVAPEGTLFVPEEALDAPAEDAFTRAFGSVPFASPAEVPPDVSAAEPETASASGSFVVERQSSRGSFTVEPAPDVRAYAPEADLYSSTFAPPASMHGTPLAAADPAAPLPFLPEPEILAPEADIEAGIEADDVDATPTWTDVVPTAVPWTPASLSEAAYDLPLPESEATAEPAPNPEEELRWSKSEVLQPTQPTKASESGYFEWTGASTRGSWKLRDAANEELTRDTDASAPAPAAARPGPAPAMAPSSQSFETYFPHFVGKPVGELEGRVAVSFEGKSAGSATSRRPATPEGTDPYADDAPQRPWRPTEFDT